MTLGEITEDSSLEVAVIRGDTSINFHTTLIAAEGDTLYVEPFMHDNNLISFKAPDLAIELIAVKPGEVPFYWSKVTISKGEYNGNICHVITSDIIGVKLNRRNSFRVYLGIMGTVMQQAGGAVYEVLVKDMSSTGIGYIVRGVDAPEYKPGELVHITYTDPESFFSIDLDGRVIRRQEMENGGILYGCRFVKIYPQVDRYVSRKQLKDRNKKVQLSR